MRYSKQRELVLQKVEQLCDHLSLIHISEPTRH